MVNPFFNERERRPRAFWRLLAQFALNAVGVVMLGSIAFALFGGTALGGEEAEEFAATPAYLAVGGVGSLMASLFSVWLVGRFFDRRPLSGFGLRLDKEWWLDFGFGLFLGALLMTGVFLAELAAGWVSISGSFRTVGGEPFFPVILVPAVWFLCVGIYEELVSRGYQLRNMAEGLNYPRLGPKGAVLLAWVVSSSIFGLLHLMNPNASFISTLGITFAGLLLGAGYVLTGRLAIPIGLHITWNFFQGNVFGFPVRGLDPIGATFVSVEQGGPPAFTGGVFGPEAGLLGLSAMVIGSLLIWLWVRARSGKAALQTSLAVPPTAVTDRTRTPGTKS